MRILYDHQIFSYQRYGGVSRYFCELMRALMTLPTVDVSLSLQYTDNDYVRSLPHLDVQSMPRPWGIPARLRFLATYFLERRYSLQELRRGRYEILHPTFYDDYFLRYSRSPFVLTIMDCIPERFPALFPRTGLYNRYVTGQWIENKRHLARSAAHVIAISESTKADVVHFYGLPPEKVEVIHLANALPVHATRPGSSIRALLSRKVMFVGSRWGYKNFPGFVKAMEPILRQDPELVVLCVGGGPFSKRELRFIRESGCSGRFVQEDMDEPSLAEAYATAAAFVFPSLWEGFGLPIVEAFACGCPCVISNTSCFPEIAGDAAEYFDPRDTESMARAISNVIYDHHRQQELIKRGFSRGARFSWRSTAEQTLQVYERVVG